MKQPGRGIGGAPLKAALRPLRGLWVFTWLLLLAAFAVKLALGPAAGG